MTEESDDAETYPIPAALDGERVDRTVALLAGVTRQVAADLVAAGAVTVDGSVVKGKGRRVRTGETLVATVGARATAPDERVLPESAVELAVVHEDDEVLVVDKPAGLVVHPGNANREHTMVAGLLARYPDLAALADEPGSEHRPGIVHRLDRGTSGLLVVARTAHARDALVAQLAAHEVERRYDVVVTGHVEADAGVVDAPLGRALRDPTAVAVRRGGRPARTRYEVVGRFGAPTVVTRLSCRLETGRTHQIRVHLAAIGHPVLGDDRYDGRPASAARPPRLLPRGRPWLHAGALAFDHPTSGRRLHFTAELPSDLAGSLTRFGPPAV